MSTPKPPPSSPPTHARAGSTTTYPRNINELMDNVSQMGNPTEFRAARIQVPFTPRGSDRIPSDMENLAELFGRIEFMTPREGVLMDSLNIADANMRFPNNMRWEDLSDSARNMYRNLASADDLNRFKALVDWTNLKWANGIASMKLDGDPHLLPSGKPTWAEDDSIPVIKAYVFRYPAPGTSGSPIPPALPVVELDALDFLHQYRALPYQQQEYSDIFGKMPEGFIWAPVYTIVGMRGLDHQTLVEFRAYKLFWSKHFDNVETKQIVTENTKVDPYHEVNIHPRGVDSDTRVLPGGYHNLVRPVNTQVLRKGIAAHNQSRKAHNQRPLPSTIFVRRIDGVAKVYIDWANNMFDSGGATFLHQITQAVDTERIDPIDFLGKDYPPARFSINALPSYPPGFDRSKAYGTVVLGFEGSTHGANTPQERTCGCSHPYVDFPPEAVLMEFCMKRQMDPTELLSSPRPPPPPSSPITPAEALSPEPAQRIHVSSDGITQRTMKVPKSVKKELIKATCLPVPLNPDQQDAVLRRIAELEKDCDTRSTKPLPSSTHTTINLRAPPPIITFHQRKGNTQTNAALPIHQVEFQKNTTKVVDIGKNKENVPTRASKKNNLGPSTAAPSATAASAKVDKPRLDLGEDLRISKGGNHIESQRLDTLLEGKFPEAQAPKKANNSEVITALGGPLNRTTGSPNYPHLSQAGANVAIQKVGNARQFLLDHIRKNPAKAGESTPETVLLAKLDRILKTGQCIVEESQALADRMPGLFSSLMSPDENLALTIEAALDDETEEVLMQITHLMGIKMDNRPHEEEQ